jgi:hypothetical protein
MHYHVEINTLICLIKGCTRHKIQSTSVVTGNSVTLLLESSLLNIDISLTTQLHFRSIYSEPAVTTHQLINQEAIYTSSCVAVDLNFNSEVFQHTLDFPLGQHIPHSTFPTHHCLWNTNRFWTLLYIKDSLSRNLTLKQ